VLEEVEGEMSIWSRETEYDLIKVIFSVLAPVLLAKYSTEKWLLAYGVFFVSFILIFIMEKIDILVRKLENKF